MKLDTISALFLGGIAGNVGRAKRLLHCGVRVKQMGEPYTCAEFKVSVIPSEV
jgi:hypothetical protein